MSIPLLNFHSQNSKNIEIVSLNDLYDRAPDFKHDASKPHRVKFYHLIYISEGEGSHLIDFNQYPYKSGSFVFVSKNQIHAFDLESRPKGKAVFFTQKFLDSTNVNIRMPFFTSNLMSLNSPVLTLNNHQKESFETLLREITNELNCDYCNNQIVEFLFSALLLKLDRERPTSPLSEQLTERQAATFSQFIALVDTNSVNSRDASVYAEILTTTYKTLNQICQLACDQTPKQLIDSHTILEAKRRLIIEKVQISELAYDLEFDEVSNFIRYFKKHTLLTPAQFKSNHLGS